MEKKQDMMQVHVVGVDGKTMVVQLGKGDDTIFQKFTVLSFKKMILKQLNEKNGTTTGDPADLRLIFGGKQLESQSANGEDMNLADYGVTNGSTMQQVMRVHGGQDEKEYDPKKHFGIKLTKGTDAIFGEDKGDTRLALMSCGHAVHPDSLTGWCRSLLDQGQYKFYCPALLKEDETKRCEKEWKYIEVRKLALLDEKERRIFETKVAEIAAQNFCDYKACPGCQSYLERRDVNNLSVHCPICTKKKGKTFEFCWHCRNEWTGLNRINVTKCGRDGCQHPSYPAVRDAEMITLDDVKLDGQVPSIRACITCGMVVEHSKKACKNIICPRCKIEFCFACLETRAECQKTAPGSYYEKCKKPIAPKQTSIPVWSKTEDGPKKTDGWCVVS